MTTNNCIIILILVLMQTIYLHSQNIDPARITNWNSPGSNQTFIFQKSVVFSSFGADATGKIACDNALQKAINALNGPGEIVVTRGTYLFEKTIALPDSIILQGEIDMLTSKPLALFKLASGNNNNGISITGNEINTNYSITYPLNQGEQKLYVNNPQLFVEGDFIKIVPFDDSLLVNNSWAYSSTGQIFQILKIENDSLVLNKPLRRSYGGNKLPLLYKLKPRRQVHIKCISIERVDTTTSQSSNIYLNNATDCSISGIESQYCNFAHICIESSMHISVVNSFLKNAHSYGSGGKGYGVMLQFTSGDCFIHQNNFEHLRHSMILQAGANGNVLAYNYSTDPFWTETILPSNSSGDLVLHGNYVYMNLFEGNVVQNIVIDNSHGNNGPFNTFFRNRAELYGIFMNNSPASDQQNFIGNQVTDNSSSLLGFYSLKGKNHFEFGNMVKGVVMPKGTNEPDISSMFDYDFTSFYKNISSIPPIRIDNWQSQSALIEPHYRFLKNKKSVCSEEIYLPVSNYESEVNGKDILYVYPNPFVNEFNVMNKSGQINCSIKVYDTLGQVVYSGKLNGEKMIINSNEWNEGIYFLSIVERENLPIKLLKF